MANKCVFKNPVCLQLKKGNNIKILVRLFTQPIHYLFYYASLSA